MKILDQAHLWFKEGKSDKVYEIDLVEVASGQHVVNFRYGRRGTALRDGTKTPMPVPLDKARALFAALVAEKTKGGYRAATGERPPPGVVQSRTPSPPDEARSQRALLQALAQGHRGTQPLRVTVRKVGDRALREAEPLLLELLRASKPAAGMKPDVWRHLLVIALARCGSSTAIAPLSAIADDEKAPPHLRDASRLAMTLIWGQADRARAVGLAHGLVPPSIRNELTRDAAPLIRTLEGWLVDNPRAARAATFGLYLLAPSRHDDEGADEEGRAARRVVLAIARVARFNREEFGLVRALYWAAELRRDGDLFSLLARRFEALRSQPPRDTPTLRYFRRRVARFLRRLGAARSPDYVKMATELLLAYRAEDAEPVRDTGFGRWDAFARYHALNFVLYSNSTRYEKASHLRATWRCQRRYKLGDPPPSVREEAYPELWDQAPEALWRLGTSAAATLVIHFATRALRDQAEFLSKIENDQLARAMAENHPLMRRLAFDTARGRAIDVVLARGALASGIDEADDWVLAWIKNDPSVALGSAELLALLVTARSPRVRAEAISLLRAQAIERLVAGDATARSVAILIGLADEPGAADRAAGAVAILLRAFGEPLDEIGLDVVRDLLAHPLAAVAELGGEIVLRRARSGPLAIELLDRLLESRHPSVRSIGARLLGETPPEIMKDQPELLVSFALSANAELRQGTRALLGEVASRYPEVGSVIASRLLDALLMKQETGVPSHIVSLLRRELAGCLPRRDPKSILALIAALSPHAREAGGLLLPQLGPDDVGLDDIVRLANNELLLVRRGACALAMAAKERFKLAPVALARLCDARWEDSRAFAFGFVRSLTADELATDAIIAICDSTQPPVQAFGQALVLERWKEEDAGRYLIRLAEHPSTNIQLLVSGLLERYAHGNLAALRELEPYLRTVLSQVNRGGVAKQRVLAFLRTEALGSAEAATLLGPLLDRQSATVAVSHKAPLISTMVAVQTHHPDISLPISIVTPPLHPGDDRGV